MSGVLRAVTGGSAAAGVALATLAAALPAAAQSSVCGEIEKSLIERRGIIQKIEGMQKAKEKPTPQEACSVFTKLVNNGTAGVKWLETNKDWCQIPDAFFERYKQDHTKMTEVRGKTCSIAAKAAAMQKAQSAKPENQLFGGPGLSGSFRMPQGAM